MDSLWRAIDEAEPGPKWAGLFAEYWPDYYRWWSRDGVETRPSYWESRRALKAHMPELLPLYDRLCELAGGGADIGAIIAAQKLGIVDLQQDGTKYFDLHHTPDDTLDKIDKAELRQNVAAWLATLAYLANYDGELKPEAAQ
mgnify:CR=1 FL=1